MKTKLREIIKNTDKTILKKVIRVDGHTIYDPKKFLEAGLDTEIVKAFTKSHYSGLSAKETIFQDGKMVESLGGVYGLELLEFIASVFGVESWKMGRGSRAAHLIEQLQEKLV